METGASTECSKENMMIRLGRLLAVIASLAVLLSVPTAASAAPGHPVAAVATAQTEVHNVPAATPRTWVTARWHRNARGALTYPFYGAYIRNNYYKLDVESEVVVLLTTGVVWCVTGIRQHAKGATSWLWRPANIKKFLAWGYGTAPHGSFDWRWHHLGNARGYGNQHC